jgi:hypothetical protein
MAYGVLLSAAQHKNSRTGRELINKDDVKKQDCYIKTFLL